MVTALKCLLREQSAYSGNLKGTVLAEAGRGDPDLEAAAGSQDHGRPGAQRNWIMLFADRHSTRC